MPDTTRVRRDGAVSPIVGVLLLVAITTSLLPGVILLVDDAPTLAPEMEADWQGWQINDSQPIETYRVDVNGLWGAGPNATATIYTPNATMTVRVSTGSVLLVPCTGPDPSAAIEIRGTVVEWNNLLACGAEATTNASTTSNTSRLVDSIPRGGDRCGIRLQERVTASGETVEIRLVVCRPLRIDIP